MTNRETSAAAQSLQPESWAQPLRKESLGDAAFNTIRVALMEGYLKPGELLHLRPLSVRFGVSVTPMREALLRLMSCNALALDDRGTVMVPVLTKSELLEVWEIRAELESRAVRITADRITDAEIEALVVLNQEIADCIAAKDFAAAVRGNTRFHVAMAKLSGRRVLYELVEDLWVRTGPILWHSFDHKAPRWKPSRHNEILEALRQRDATAAGTALREEILAGSTSYLHFAAPDPQT
jgi:DNA-binding GntR family transcriptional regulator